MKRWMNAIGLTAALGTITAAIVMQACSSSRRVYYMPAAQPSPSRQELDGVSVAANDITRQRHMMNSPPEPGGYSLVEPPTTAPTKPTSPAPVTLGNQIAGGNTALPDGEVPRIHVQQALRANRGGGGGQSPFRESDDSIVTYKLKNKPAVDIADVLNSLAWSSRVAPQVTDTGPAEFTLRPGEELWVIERRTTFAPSQEDDRPGCGSLMTQIRERPQPNAQDDDSPYRTVPVPLKHTDVQAQIDGYIGTVSVKQEFINPYSEKIEAVYVFPLPENAAVNEFLMTIGDRTIRGIIREREEAEKIYQIARQQGHTASLLTQDRPNIFTQHVANIEPGKEIDIDIRYFHTLAYRDGWYEWAFPMVVGPRFNPPHTKDGVGAVARGQYGASGQATEVQYLRPGERSGHDVSVHVKLDAGVPIESVECRTHQVTVAAERATPQRADISLASLDTIPNKDFVLRYRIAGRDVKSAMLTQATDKGGFFSLMLVPPADLQYLSRGPMEMVFVIDCSGSMEGEPIAQAKRAVEHALQGLNNDDTFQVINFAESASQFGARPIPATYENVRRGVDYVRSLNSNGGTMMMNGLKASLGFPHDPRRLRFVCFLTDGYIGNEAEILGALRKDLDDSRIFAFGIGTSVNRYLIEEMAKMGRGVAGFLGPGDDAADVMDRFLDRVSHAALCDLRIDWGGMDVDDVYPKRLPDLYVGRPVIVTGRYRGSGATTIKVTGRAGKEKMPILVPVNMTGCDSKGLAPVWARSRITELAEQVIAYPASETYPRQIREVALSHGLMSAYTSFVAVDSLTRTAGRMGTTVDVPVNTPEGVKYNTTVQERSQRSDTWRPGQDHP